MPKSIFTGFILFAYFTSNSQDIDGRLKFQQGDTLQIRMDVNNTLSQEAMGQVIDLKLGATALHDYVVAKTSSDSSTLKHEVRRIQFNFEGMGQKYPFDSYSKSDMEGPFGPTMEDMLKRSFDMVISPSGKVLQVRTEKAGPIEKDDKLKTVTNMLKEVLAIVQPPQKGVGSFFQVLPDRLIGPGQSWEDSIIDQTGKYHNKYTLTEITDSTIVVDVTGNSLTSSRMEPMAGREIITTMNCITSGKIILDIKTGLVRQKTFETISTGTAKGMGTETPLHSKSVINIIVLKK